MHPRHRNPANGYSHRSNPIGIGGAGGGVVAGAAGYRSYNRTGFGRGQPKIFQSGPPPPLPRRVDVFMEAGKLATEYLVSKGLLPPNSLNGKWPNGTLKNQIGGGGVDGVSDAVSGTGGGRRRIPDDYGPATGSRDTMRLRRSMGSFKNPGFESDREINRSSSWSEKVKGSSDKQEDDDSGKDDVREEQKSESADLESTIDNKQNQLPDDNAGLNAPSSEVSNECGVESAEKSDCSKNNDEESEKPAVTEDSPEENSAADNNNDSANKNGSDLLALIRINKVPTRTRSSLALKGSRVDSVSNSGNEKRIENQNSEEPATSLLYASISDGPSEEKQELNQESDVQEAPSMEEVAELDQKYEFAQGLCTQSQSFPQGSSVSEQESGSAALGRGEKRPILHTDSSEGSKKPRDWGSSNDENDQTDEFMHLSNLRQEGRAVIGEPSNIYSEEKQLFPSSFKICDLNLMEVSDVNENHNANSVINFPSIGQMKQEPVSVDFDLSMTSSRTGVDGKEIEVIDLDCDSVQDKVFDNAERKDETIFTDLESFPDSIQRVSDMPQDGYGLMISELLEADIPNSSVSTGVNSLHNDMGLRNEEGILGDDESIYMSLGEIPISFVPVWDQQPTQGYDKRY